MGRKIAIHQPNFCPWLPFFYKMSMSDTFILLNNAQYVKGNFHNRYKTHDKWVTKSVNHGIEPLIKKKYSDGQELFAVNRMWIDTIKTTLGIKAHIVNDFDLNGIIDPTDRLIFLIKWYGGDIYITNPSARDKYLDEEKMKDSGINIEYCNVPPHLQIHTFEAFEKWGIDGTARQLPRNT